MLQIGLTGNIGSGKTTVARIFETLGAAVFNADEQAKTIIGEEPQKTILITRFGDQILDNDKKIDRKSLAGIIFRDKEALDFVNHLIHPLVRKRFKEFCLLKAKATLRIYEAAVLIESGFYKQLDKIILITAPEEIRIRRVIERDKTNEEQVRQRMRNQWNESKKAMYSDFVIINDNETPLLEQCISVYHELIS
jgi:dephospho-CoA kinase